MKDIAAELPGIARIRMHFLSLLGERQATLAGHALAAWEADTPQAVTENLAAAEGILHQIAGSAGSLGLDDLGEAAHLCEMAIMEYLQGDDTPSGPCPVEIMERIDAYVALGQRVLVDHDQG